MPSPPRQDDHAKLTAKLRRAIEVSPWGPPFLPICAYLIHLTKFVVPKILLQNDLRVERLISDVIYSLK